MIFTFGKGTGGKGVYITVTCDPAYQGYNIICTTGSVSKTKTCGSNHTVQFMFTENEVSILPATFTISNSLNGIIQIETANMYGWYETTLDNIRALIPTMTSNTTPYGEAFGSTWNGGSSCPMWNALDNNLDTMYASNVFTGANSRPFGYSFVNPVCIKKMVLKNSSDYRQNAIKEFIVEGSNTINSNDWHVIKSGLINDITTSTEKEFDLSDNEVYYKTIRINPQSISGTVNTNNFHVNKLQFYGY